MTKSWHTLTYIDILFTIKKKLPKGTGFYIIQSIMDSTAALICDCYAMTWQSDGHWRHSITLKARIGAVLRW